MKNKTVFLLFIILILFYYPLFSLNLHVSIKNGSDANTGTSWSNPLKTLDGARKRIRILISGGIPEDITVFFEGGVYFIDTPVEFTEEDSNPTGNTITYENNGDDQVFFAGGKKIDLNPDIAPLYRGVAGTVDASALFENRERGIEVQNPSGLPVDEMKLKLDSPGKYYYDGNVLYYYPRNNPESVFIPKTDTIIALRGDSDISPVENIIFRDLIIIGTKYKPSGITDFSEETGLIYIENAENITVDSCELIGSGVSGVVVDKYARNVQIQNSRVDDFNLHGISLRGYMPGDGAFDASSHNEIFNNLIVSGAHKSAYGSGIRVFRSRDNEIHKNRIQYISGSGIIIHGPDTCNNSVKYNDISRITPQTEGGGIYLFRSETDTIENNCIHDIYLKNAGITPTGIYIGESANNITVRKNIIHTIVGSNSKGMAVFTSGNNCTIENNIFSDYGTRGGLGFNASNGHARNLTITHNIFNKYNGNYFYFFVEWQNPNFRGSNHNLMYHQGGSCRVKTPYKELDITEWRQIASDGYDRQSETGEDPEFEEPESHYYKVQNGSPALGMGFENIIQNNIGLEPSFAHRYARDIIEAEDYIASPGTQNRATTIRSSSNGNYARYGSIYFNDGLQNVEIKLSCDAPSGSATGRTLSLEAPPGNTLCTIPVNGTGGITSYTMKRSSINAVSGLNDVFIRFEGSTPPVQVDWFRFYEQDPPEEPSADFNMAPYVTINFPQDKDEFLIGSNITISAKAHDPDGSIERMWCYLNGKEFYNTSGASLSYTLENVSMGTYEIRVAARDNDGSRGEESIEISVLANLSQPVVEILEPEDNQHFIGPCDILIRVTASDPVKGIRNVQLYANDQLLHTEYAVGTTTYNFSLEYNWIGVQPGEYLIRAVAVNNAGTTSETAVFIWVDAERLLIGYWPMDSVVGGIVEDVSGHEFHGIATNVTETDGVRGGACYFDGFAFVTTEKPLMDALPYFTLAGWVKPESGGDHVGFFGQTGVLGFGFVNDLLLQIFTPNKGGIETGFPESHLKTWHHVAVIGDGKGLRLYYDGKLKAGPTNDSVSDYGRSENPFNIGGGGIFGTTDTYFTGAIDDVRLYSYAISETELQALASKSDNIRPHVKIVNPPGGSSFDGPVDIIIFVEAYDRDGFVEQVEVYTQDYTIGIDFEAPYEFPWYGVSPGTYYITAKATDNEGAESTDTIMINVNESGSDLIAYWNLDEGAGLVVNDTSGNENHGDILSTDWAEGIRGNCLFFDSYGIVKIRKQGLINGLPAFTVAYWMRPTNIKTVTGILGQYGAFISSFNETSNISVWTLGGNHTYAPIDIHPDEWTHITTVGTGQQLIIYINGEAAAAIDSHTSNYGESDAHFEIGGIRPFDSEGNYYQGYLDEVYIYKRALKEYEIKTLARRPAPKSPSLRIMSPQNISRHVIGGPVNIQAQVVKADLTGVYLECSVDGSVVNEHMEEPYTMEWVFEDTGDHTISLQGYSDSGYWAEDTVTITIITEEEEAEDDENDEEENTDEDISSEPGDETDPDDWDDDNDDDDDQYDEDGEDEKYPDDLTTMFAHASQEEIYKILEGKEEGIREGETMIQYIERILREKKKAEEEGNGKEEGNKWDDSVRVVLGEDGKPVTGPTNPPGIKGDGTGKTEKKENNGKSTNSASTQNWSSWLFGNTGSDGGTNNNRPGFIYIIIIVLAVIAAVFAGIVIMKKLKNRKKMYY